MVPVIERLANRVGVAISVDTMKPGVARAALAVGASIVNDVAANRKDDTMWQLVAGSRGQAMCCHPYARHTADDAGPIRFIAMSSGTCGTFFLID